MKYYEKVNARGNYQIKEGNVLFDNGRVSIYVEDKYAEKNLCVAFARKILVINTGIENGFYKRSELFIDHLDKIAKSNLKTICSELIKLGVMNENTELKENRLNKTNKLNLTVKEILATY